MTGRNFKLQQLRAIKHWTLRAAAENMRVSITVLFSAEQGVMPRVDHAVQIARALQHVRRRTLARSAIRFPQQSADTKSRGRPLESPSSGSWA